MGDGGREGGALRDLEGHVGGSRGGEQGGDVEAASRAKGQGGEN